MKFQNPSIHRSKVNRRTDRQTDKPKAICPSNFFKVGGIKSQLPDAVCQKLYLYDTLYGIAVLFIEATHLVIFQPRQIISNE